MTATADAKTACERTDYERRFGRCEQLEGEITELWAYMNVATRQFLKLIAEYDRDKGCERRGLVNTAQWLNWQCGIGMLAAREKVRVARALEGLPEIDAAFAKGEVSYSKVRAMTRVATPANEAALLNIARHGTASHVEQLVRKYRWTQRRDAAKLAKDQYLGRQAFFFYDDTDAFVLHARLPPEVGAIVRKALEVAGDVLRAAKRTEVSAETSPGVAAETGSRGASGIWTEDQLEASSAAKRADALRLMAETFLNCRSEEVEGTSSADRYQVVVHVDLHEGGYGVTATDDGMLVFTRPDGRTIPECGGPRVVSARAQPLADRDHDGSFRGNFSGSSTEPELDPFERGLQSYMRSLKPDLHVDSRTGNCRWLGETMDYSLAIEGLQCLDGGWNPPARAVTPAGSAH